MSIPGEKHRFIAALKIAIAGNTIEFDPRTTAQTLKGSGRR